MEGQFRTYTTKGQSRQGDLRAEPRIIRVCKEELGERCTIQPLLNVGFRWLQQLPLRRWSHPPQKLSSIEPKERGRPPRVNPLEHA